MPPSARKSCNELLDSAFVMLIIEVECTKEACEIRNLFTQSISGVGLDLEHFHRR